MIKHVKCLLTILECSSLVSQILPNDLCVQNQHPLTHFSLSQCVLLKWYFAVQK